MSKKIIGIDLGTTNSLAAVWENKKSCLIPNSFGEYLTPSVVSVDDDGTIYVGKTAKERLISHPDQTAAVFKRYMGMNKEYVLGKKKYMPEELSAFVLKKLKEDAERYLGEEVEEAIISVPAYFNDMARNATKRAGRLAGLKVDRIINEPSAAALAGQEKNPEEDATVLIFDFGGGTLDVSLVECFDNVIEILAVSGDNQLGGEDFDNMIARHFIRHNNLDVETLSPGVYATIKKSAEKCKRELTEHKSADMVVNCPEVYAKMEISRKDVAEFCLEIFERMRKPVFRVLMDVKVSADSISRIILVGGSCKMPVVQQYLRHILNRNDIETREPDHMIALGCGVCAGIKERDEEVKDMLLTDICPFSLGVGVMDQKYMSQSFDIMSFIIPRNSVLPVSKERIYVTAYDNQTGMQMNIYQGESMYAKDNILLGQMFVKIPPRPAGKVQCMMRFTYDINGVLEVNLHIPLTGEKKQLVIVNNELGMDEEEIQKKLKEYEKLKLNPAESEENRYVLEWGERLYIQCSGELREEILQRMLYFNHIMEKDPYRIPKVRKYLTVFFAYVEGVLERFVNLDSSFLQDADWYDDEEDEEVEQSFKDWTEEDDK